MKKILKYSGICSLLLAAVAFVLMLATPAVVAKSGSTSINFGGALAIFGGNIDNYQKLYLLADTAKGAPLALIAWILALIGLLIVCTGVILPLLKVKALDKFAGVLNLIAVASFVLAGVFSFIVVPSFFTANGFDKVPDSAAIGGGWVIGGIVYIVAGAVAICPAVADFLAKKK